MEVGRPCRLCSPAVTFSHFTWRQKHIETGGGRKGGLASRSAGCVSSQTSGKQSVGGGGKFSGGGGGGGGPARPTPAFVVLRAATPATPPSL